MAIFYGHYSVQPLVAFLLATFPNVLTFVKKIRQFLGIVNYIIDLISNLAQYTTPLFAMIKKNSPPWSDSIHAVVQLKQLRQINKKRIVASSNKLTLEKIGCE